MNSARTTLVCKRNEKDGAVAETSRPVIKRRKVVADNLRKQAEKMVERGKDILPPIQVRDNVLLDIPVFDWGHGDDSAHFIAVVVEEKEGKLRLATKYGFLDRWLERNSVHATAHKSVTVGNVLEEKEYSLRELVRHDSVGMSRGYRKCCCRGNCMSKKCLCLKNGLGCNSGCHPGYPCENVD